MKSTIKTEESVAKVVARRQVSALERTHVPELLKGLGGVLRRLLQVAAGESAAEKAAEEAALKGTAHGTSEPLSVQRLKNLGQHRLLLHEDGGVRCVACMCCSSICPARCIQITAAAEVEGSAALQPPESFVIDELRCISCGLCVEVCPYDALGMDGSPSLRALTNRKDAHLRLDLPLSPPLGLPLDLLAKRGEVSEANTAAPSKAEQTDESSAQVIT